MTYSEYAWNKMQKDIEELKDTVKELEARLAEQEITMARSRAAIQAAQNLVPIG